ncbi:MAG: polysaccharide deacetylase family protein [Verrucomicrobia bacterium]|nr:polysaccharide deacetylase family protein [Verrucomicrobiota bacterium]
MTALTIMFLITDTHPILTHLNSADLEREVGVNIAKLSAHLSCPIQHFSYPEGQAWCYSDAVITVLKQHGILCAPTAEPGINHVEDDLFHLKRIPVI